VNGFTARGVAGEHDAHVLRLCLAAASTLLATMLVQPAFASAAPVAPSNLRLGTVTATSAQLLWTLGAVDGSDVQVGYGLTGLPGLIIISAGFDTTSTTITNLQVGKSYDFKVRACSVSACSGWSNIVTDAYGWFRLSVSTTGAGKVTSTPGDIVCGQGSARCSQLFAPGSVVALVATPYINLLKGIEYDLDHWDGVCSGASYSCSLMLTHDSTTRAVFN